MHSEAGIKAEPSAVDCNSTYIERWSEEFSLFAEHAGSMQSVLGFGAPSNNPRQSVQSNFERRQSLQYDDFKKDSSV